jgi:hypothetical protein
MVDIVRGMAGSEADKTSLIHFTCRPTDEEPPNLRFCEVDITSSPSVKVLGVTLDVKLAMDEHISRVTIKGLQACLTL